MVHVQRPPKARSHDGITSDRDAALSLTMRFEAPALSDLLTSDGKVPLGELE